MKNLTYIILIALLAFTTSCGDSGPNVDTAVDENETKLKGYEELDLTPYGFEMALMVPNAVDNGEAEVIETERGTLEIKVGKSFGIEIMFGDGNIELLKQDLKESLVFTSEIIKEEEDALIYTQDIPDAGIKTTTHFFYKKQLGNDSYEIRDLIDEEYGMALIEKMLIAVKEIKPKAISAPAADETTT